jgi:hypothetical protein
MNHFSSLSIALALAAALVAPAEAAKKKQPEKGQAPAAAAQKHVRAPAPRSQQRVAVHQPKHAPSQRSAQSKTNYSAQRNYKSQRNFASQQNLAQTRTAQATRLPAVSARSSTWNSRSAQVNTSVNTRDYRSNSSNRSYNYNTSYYRAPYSVYRGWDTGRVHYWNSRPYHWFGGSWVIVDAYDDAPTVVYSSGGGYSTSLVSDVQSRLADAGYDPGPVDGVIGSGTRNAIAAYQSDHGLAVTGRIDTSLLRSLRL